VGYKIIKALTHEGGMHFPAVWLKGRCSVWWGWPDPAPLPEKPVDITRLRGPGAACPEPAVFGTGSRKLSTGSSSWRFLQPQPRSGTHRLEDSVFLFFFNPSAERLFFDI